MADTGRAAVFVGPTTPFELPDSPIPTPPPVSLRRTLALSTSSSSALPLFPAHPLLTR